MLYSEEGLQFWSVENTNVFNSHWWPGVARYVDIVPEHHIRMPCLLSTQRKYNYRRHQNYYTS
jgi:hypothetical protein